MKRSTGTKSVCRTSPWLHSVAVAAAAVTCYYPSLRGGLVFDDIAAIKDNKDVRPHVPLSNLFWHDFWGTPLHKEQSHKSYRPFTVLTFRWNYGIHGLDPWGYHLVNVILHTVVCILYLRFCRMILRVDHALVAALLFAVHPIHTDAVASVVGRAELLSAACFLGALLCYCRIDDNTASRPGWQEVALPVVFSAVGTLCKEQALTALIVCVLADLLVLNRVPLSRELLHCIFVIKPKTPPWYRTLVIKLRITAAAFIVLLVLRIRVMGQYFPAFNRLDNPSSVSSLTTRILTYNHLVAFNAWLLLFPQSLCCDWSSESVPLVRTIFDVQNLGTLIFYIFLLKLIYHGTQENMNILRLSLVMMAVPFLPATNLFFPVGFVIAERVMYLPSMGFCLLIALGWSVLRDHSARKVVINLGLCLLLLLHGLKTTRRCLDWESEKTLYRAGIEVNPRNVKLLNNMGRLMEKSGRLQEALVHYFNAVRVHPDDVTGHLNLGNVYTSLQMYQQAEDAYLQARALLPKPDLRKDRDNRVTVQHLKALLQLATLISRNSSRLEEADRLYAQVVSLRTDYTEAYVGWGNLMLRTNRTREAEFVLEKALEQDEENPNMLYNLGIVLTEQGKSMEALALFNRALTYDPHHEPSLLASAKVIQDEGLYELQGVALQRLRQVAELGEGDETVYFNLGIMAVKLGDHRSAEEWFLQALQIRGDFPEALFNIALLLYEDSRPIEAATFLRTLLEHKQEHVKGLLLLGDIYVSYVENLDAAEECYLKVLKMEPKNHQGLHNLCVVYVKRHQLERALDCFREALRLAPHVDYIQRHLHLTGLLLQQDGDNSSGSTNMSDVRPHLSDRPSHLLFDQ